MNPRHLIASLILHLVLAVSASAEIIGVEQFDYPDGTIATKNGGTFWDYKNFTPTGHTGTASNWDNFTGAPVVTSGRLVTDNSSAKREYHGAPESDGAVNDPASAPSSVAKTVYYRVTFTTGATLPSFISISSSDFGTDIVSFGVSMDLPNDNKFSFRIHPQSSISNSSTLATPNTTYTLVAKLDYANNVASLYLNPDLNAAEGSQTPLRTTTNFTATNWSTAVRLASGTGGAVSWDDLVVATTWDDLGTVVTTATDEDGSLNPATGTGVSLREAVKYSLSGTLVTFAPALSGKTITLTGGQLVVPGHLTIDATALPFGLTIDGNNATRLFLMDNFNTPAPGGRSLALKSLTLTRGNALLNGDGGSGGAIRNYFSILNVSNCTFTENFANRGGAISSHAPLVDCAVRHCTFTGNSGTLGSALYNGLEQLLIEHCTISGNISRTNAGAVATFDSDTHTTVNHSIIAGNSGEDVNNEIDPAFVSQGYNLIGTGDGIPAFNQIGDRTGVTDPKLSPLGYFGGPTMTMHPLIGSPAIDAGSTTDPGGTDQRGLPRFVDGDGNGILRQDIGSVETGPLATLLLIATYPVTTAVDEDNGVINPLFGAGTSLREAIKYAPDGSVITFASGLSGAIITLTPALGEIVAGKTLFLDASNLSAPVTVSGNNASRVFNIPAGATVAMHSLNIINGKAADGTNGTVGNPATAGGDGGGIRNSGVLNLIACRVANCRSGNGGSAGGSGDTGAVGGHGGGIFSDGLLSLTSSAIENNQTGNGGNSNQGSTGFGGSGGGIFSSGVARLTACSIANNLAGNGGNGSGGGSTGGFGGHGGGVASTASLTLSACSVTSNRSGNGGSGFNQGGGGGDGGGIYSREFPRSTAVIDSSTISDNRTGDGGVGFFGNLGSGDGGGAFLDVATIRSSTIAQNQTAARGGGIEVRESVVLEHSTVAANVGTAGGGGIESNAALTLRHSMVAGNSGSSGPDILSIFTPVTYQGANFVGSTSGISYGSGPAPLTGNALLAPLGDYGGPTFTMALKPTSPARNAATGSTRTTDQRGFPTLGTPDLGAYEAGTPANYNAFIYETLPATATDAQYATTFDFDGDSATNGDEWFAGTEPGNSVSVFRVSQLTRSGDNVSLTFPSVAGRIYRFDVAFALGNPTSWLPLVDGASLFTVPGTGAPLTVPLGAFPGQTSLFFRIHVGP